MKIHNKLTDSADVITYVVSQFLPGAEVSGIEQWFAGHINRTYFVDCSDRGCCCVRFVLQYMNGEVFRDLDGLMQNVIRVSEQMARAARKSGGPDVERCYLHFIRTVSGEYAFKSEKLGFWRMYRYIGNAVGKLVAETNAEAYSAGFAFGKFQNMLAGMEGPRLNETIAGFHDTRGRFAALRDAASKDVCGRLDSCRGVYGHLLELEKFATKLQAASENGEIPERTVHNDAKLSNVLLDASDFHPVCVIDLDTCMPGLAGHDFGDLARSICSDSPEDEPDTSRISVRLDMFESIVTGYVSGADGALTREEILTLPDGAVAMTLEVAVRFLTDYLSGDTYFRTKFPEHNLQRAKAQLALGERMIDKMPVMKEIAEAACPQPK